MEDVKNFDNGALAPSSLLELTDRRRPGRVANVSPELVPLLRQPATIELPPAAPIYGADEYEEPHDLAAMQGITVAVLLSIPIWMMIRAAVLMILS